MGQSEKPKKVMNFDDFAKVEVKEGKAYKSTKKLTDKVMKNKFENSYIICADSCFTEVEEKLGNKKPKFFRSAMSGSSLYSAARTLMYRMWQYGEFNHLLIIMDDRLHTPRDFEEELDFFKSYMCMGRNHSFDELSDTDSGKIEIVSFSTFMDNLKTK